MLRVQHMSFLTVGFLSENVTFQGPVIPGTTVQVQYWYLLCILYVIPKMLTKSFETTMTITIRTSRFYHDYNLNLNVTIWSLPSCSECAGVRHARVHDTVATDPPAFPTDKKIPLEQVTIDKLVPPLPATGTSNRKCTFQVPSPPSTALSDEPCFRFMLRPSPIAGTRVNQ